MKNEQIIQKHSNWLTVLQKALNTPIQNPQTPIILFSDTAVKTLSQSISQLPLPDFVGQYRNFAW